MSSNQYLTIAGNVGRDPERKTVNDKLLVTFSVAQNQPDGTTTWWRVTCWEPEEGDTALAVRKGDTVAANGKIKIGEWEGKKQYDLTAYSLTILDWQRGRKDALPF